jgi:hypothetical protein
MSFEVVWKSRPGHVHVMEMDDARCARQLANTLQGQQGTASVVDKATGIVIFRPPWIQLGKPLKQRRPGAN